MPAGDRLVSYSAGGTLPAPVEGRVSTLADTVARAIVNALPPSTTPTQVAEAIAAALVRIDTSLGTKVDTAAYTTALAAKVSNDTYTAGLATKADLVDGKVPTSQIAAISTHETVPVNTTADRLALTSSQVQPGDESIVATGTSAQKGRWLLLSNPPSDPAAWLRLSAPGGVQSVNGQTVPDIVLGPADVGATPAAHATDTTNPHAVTKAQVGLANVPNVDARERTTHTGQQSATTVDESADRKWLTAAEQTKLASLGPSVIAQVVPATPAGPPGGTATEQTLVSLPLAANRIAAGDVFNLDVIADTMNISGSVQGIVFRVYIGGVLVAATSTINTGSSAVAASGFSLAAIIQTPTTADQRWFIRTGSSSPNGINTEGQRHSGVFRTTSDLTTTKNIDITCQWLTATTGSEVRLYGASLRRSRP